MENTTKISPFKRRLNHLLSYSLNSLLYIAWPIEYVWPNFEL